MCWNGCAASGQHHQRSSRRAAQHDGLERMVLGLYIFVLIAMTALVLSGCASISVLLPLKCRYISKGFVG